MFVPEGFVLLVSCMVLLSVESSRASKIIDGEEVEPHSLPFMALLKDECGEPVCGGTLISPSWVLTAAHCHGVPRTTAVILGMHNMNEYEEDSWQYRKVKHQFIHPRYRPCSNNNDLMLLKLNKAVKQTKMVKPFTLGDTMKEPAAGTECLVSGWGYTNTTVREMSDVLMSANVSIVDRVQCTSTYPELTRNMICAGSDGTSSADTCQGDSGGPLVCNGALVGVTSFGIGCGLPDIPGVYAFLTTKNLNWIKGIMKKY